MKINTRVVVVLKELVPMLVLWAAFFCVGLWIRHEIPLDAIPGEIHGYDYNGHGELFRNYHNILFTRFRHPLFGWLMSPVFLFGARFNELSIGAYWGYLVFIFSGIVTLSIWVLYRLIAAISGVGKTCAVLCVGIFASFGYVRYLAACPESFPVSMLLSIVALWWGIHSPFVSKASTDGKSELYDRIVWAIIFFVATGITITQGAKIALAYIVTRKLSKKLCLSLAFGVIGFLLLGAGFYVVKLVLLGAGGRSIGVAFAELFSCIAQDLSWYERFKMIEVFFFEPIVPHGVEFAVSEIKKGYESLWPYVICSLIYISAIVGSWRMRRTKLVQMIFAMFSVDVIIHLVFFWGMREAQIYCGHWFYALPILIAGALRRREIQKGQQLNTKGSDHSVVTVYD